MLRSVQELNGYTIRGSDGDIGSVKDLFFDDQRWTVRYLVADTNKWLPASRKVVIPPIAVTQINVDDETVTVNLTTQQIENSPPLEQHQPVSRRYEIDLFRHYGYAHYWMGPGLWGTYPRPAPLADAGIDAAVDWDDPDADPHLRSAKEVKGYRLGATDTVIGHIEDFILDQDSWCIAFIEIDTRNWWPGGRNVLITPDCIREIHWLQHRVDVALSSDAIKNGPEFDERILSNPREEDILRCHYIGSPADSESD